MHLVVDVRMLRHAGIGTYIRNVVPRLIAARRDWEITLLAPNDPGAAVDWVERGRVRIVQCTSEIYSIREQFELPRRSPRGADLFWSPHYNVPVFSRTPLVVTVHDVIHLALADMYGGGVRQVYARQMFAAVRRGARAIIFNSAFTRQQFEKFVGPARRSTTVHLGVDESWSAPTVEEVRGRPYLLFVGSVKPHKNVGALLRAFESLLPKIEHDLLIIGDHGKQRTVDYAALQLASRIGSRVKVLEDVDDAALKTYVSNATALILPSLYEGFGLPALEAMAAGCPCIVSTAASLPEVCGDAALYCDPRDPSDIARQIMRFVDDAALRARMVTAGLARAAQFNWDRVALETAVVLEDSFQNSRL